MKTTLQLFNYFSVAISSNLLTILKYLKNKIIIFSYNFESHMKFCTYILIYFLVYALNTQVCTDACYNQGLDINCRNHQQKFQATTLHMSVHPHLDAFWIFTFDSYYDPKPTQGNVRGYFASNRFNSVKQIFHTAVQVLNQSKTFRETYGEVSQKARRTFMNSQMGFFKHWYEQQDENTKSTVKQLLKTKYWEILGGGFVEHDQAGAYYEDIIQNFQLGLHFLEKQFDYYPKVAISADSFGHSQSNIAIMSHVGIQAFLAERSDEHLLTKSKMEFLWRARSTNKQIYGTMPTHLRWAIHGFQDQFIRNGGNRQLCQQKSQYIQNLRTQNQFLKKIYKSNHIMRYFGHDFQMFDSYSYDVIETIMKQFSKQKCNKLIATYGNPTQYFKNLYHQVYSKNIKPVQFREEDVFPIWDYDSGLYWTGYYTTDPYHKKIYRDAGRFLQMTRKAFTANYIDDLQSVVHKEYYTLIEKFEEQVAYLQHHDGITGTSKYEVMDHYENIIIGLQNQIASKIFKETFQAEYPINTNTVIFECYLDQQCIVPDITTRIYLKIFNSGGKRLEPVKLFLPFGKYYSAGNQTSETVCLCHILPCNCTLYLYMELYTYNFVILTPIEKPENIFLLKNLQPSNPQLSIVNNTHLSILMGGKKYQIGYKKIVAESTPRRYDHLSRYGNFIQRGFNINSGKYALGNNPNKISDFSQIDEVSWINTAKSIIILVNWKKQGMKTLITIHKNDSTVWKVESLFYPEMYNLADYYLQIKTGIKNKNEFYVDSNGWLVMKRTLFHHEDYEAHFDPNKYDDVDGNSYPMTSFMYIEDQQDKVSVNTDRPQGVIVYQQGNIWINIDRLSSDDGKWVYENTYRGQYKKLTHYVCIRNKQNKERQIQKMMDQGIYIQGNTIQATDRIEDISSEKNTRQVWAQLSNIDKIKFNVKVWDDKTMLLRIHNMHDNNNMSLSLFATNISTFLSSYYGRQLQFSGIYQTNIAGNMKYTKFLEDKWNWNKVTDMKKDYEIFNKVFSEQIVLRPLQIRAFKIINPKFKEECILPNQLQYVNSTELHNFDFQKPFPLLQSNPMEIQSKNFLLNGKHCEDENAKHPILIPLDKQNKSSPLDNWKAELQKKKEQDARAQRQSEQKRLKEQKEALVKKLEQQRKQNQKKLKQLEEMNNHQKYIEQMKQAERKEAEFKKREQQRLQVERENQRRENESKARAQAQAQARAQTQAQAQNKTHQITKEQIKDIIRQQIEKFANELKLQQKKIQEQLTKQIQQTKSHISQQSKPLIDVQKELSFDQLSELIERNVPLTKKQKSIYFAQKLNRLKVLKLTEC